MDEDRWAAYAPLTGLGALVLVVIAALLVNDYEYLKAPDKIVAKLEDNAITIQAAAYVGVVAAFLLIWFSGSVRTWLRPVEGDPGRLSAVAFGGGVAAGGCVLLGYGAVLAAAARAGSDGGTTESAATPLWDFYGTALGNLLPVALAVLIGAATVVAFRTGVMKRWLTWASAVLTLGLLTPFGYIFVAFGLLWVGVISVVLYVGGRAAAETG